MAPSEGRPTWSLRIARPAVRCVRGVSRLEEGDAPDEAKGYGIWLAKVVVARRPVPRAWGPPAGEHGAEAQFRSVGDEVQADETFDEEIGDRLGRRFYDQVFVPAVTGARAQGTSYADVRDAIRAGWKPAKSRAR